MKTLLFLRQALFVGWGLWVLSSAWADERLMPTSVPAVVKQECAACHMAYPPGMLPKLHGNASWAIWIGITAPMPR